MGSSMDRVAAVTAAERTEAYALLRVIVGTSSDMEVMLVAAKFLGMDAADIVEERRRARGLPAARSAEGGQA